MRIRPGARQHGQRLWQITTQNVPFLDRDGRSGHLGAIVSIGYGLRKTMRSHLELVRTKRRLARMKRRGNR